MRLLTPVALLAWVLTTAPLRASTPVAPPEALAAQVKTLLVQHLPTPLYESSPGWGHTRLVMTGLHWEGKGLDVHARVRKGERNNGAWRRVQVTAINPGQNLIVDVRNVVPAEPGRTLFDVFVSLPVRIDYEHQEWKAGVRLYSAGARGRVRLNLRLQCELTSRSENKGGLLPDFVFRLRVVRADLTYDQFVLEHIAGVGGDTAKVIGDAVRKGLHRWHPSLERNLVARADAAIVKAGDTKEIHVSLSELLKSGPKFGPKR